MGSITAANTTFLLAVAGLFPIPQQMQGFGAADIFSTESVPRAETVIGVDGKQSGGFVFSAVPQGVNLQADSLSNDFFDAWIAAQKAARDTLIASGIVVWPSLGRKWTLTNGILVTGPQTPSAGKILQPRKFTINWESVDPAPV